MPQIFKALATITAWTLFFLGWLMLVFVFVFMACHEIKEIAGIKA